MLHWVKFIYKIWAKALIQWKSRNKNDTKKDIMLQWCFIDWTVINSRVKKHTYSQQIYSEHCCLLTVSPVDADWPLRVASQLTETLFIHSSSERVRLLLQLYRPSFSRSPALLSWDLLLPSTFQLRLQSDGKPLLATHTSVAVFREEISALEGGRTLTLGGVTPERSTEKSVTSGFPLGFKRKLGEILQQHEENSQRKSHHYSFNTLMLTNSYTWKEKMFRIHFTFW